MPFCKNCGAKLNGNELFCGSCGKEVHPEAEQGVPQQLNAIPVTGQENGDNHEDHILQPLKDKPKRKKLPIIAIAIVLIAIIGGTGYYFGMRYYIRSNPVRWTDYSIEKTLKADTIETSGTTKLFISSAGTGTENAQALDIVNNLTISTDTKTDRNKKETYCITSVMYKGQNVIDAKAYLDSSGIIISVPALYEKNFYINYDELNKLNSGNNAASNVDLNEYKELFNVSGDKNFNRVKKDYLNFLGDKLKVNFTNNGTSNIEVTKSNGQKNSIKCDELNFTINNDQITNIVKAIIQKAAGDKNLKAFSKSKLQQFLSIVDKRNDYDKFNMSKIEAKDYIKNFDSNYDKAMKKLNSELNATPEQSIAVSGQYVKFNSTMFIGSDNYIRGYNMNLNCSAFYIQSNNTVNSINERITIDKLDKSNAVDIAKLDDASKQEIINKMTQNVYSIIISKLGMNIFNGTVTP